MLEAVQVLLHLALFAEGFLPLFFQRAGHQSVFRVDAAVMAFGALRFITGTLRFLLAGNVFVSGPRGLNSGLSS